jgi:hypothetical protein
MTPAILTPFLHLTGSGMRLWEEAEPGFDKAIFKISRKITEIFCGIADFCLPHDVCH